MQMARQDIYKYTHNMARHNNNVHKYTHNMARHNNNVHKYTHNMQDIIITYINTHIISQIFHSFL